MKGASTRRLMRKMRGLSRRIKGAFRSRGGQITSGSVTTTRLAVAPAPTVAPSSTYVIKVPAATKNFNFSTAVSTLPASFGTFVPGGVDASTFTINLNSKYSADNLPQFLVTGYVYSSTAGYIQVQRQFGVQTAVAAAMIKVDPAVKKITFENMTKMNFPSTANDSKGFALHIAFQILN